MRLRNFTYSLLIILFCLVFARTTSAQALDISSGGQPTITGAVGGSVTGGALVTDDLVVTINFGEVSPLNTNSIVKVTVPFALRRAGILRLYIPILRVSRPSPGDAVRLRACRAPLDPARQRENLAPGRRRKLRR